MAPKTECSTASHQTSMEARACVRPMTQSDVRTVAQLHLQAFPDYFTSRLGAQFLCVYYDAIATFRNGIGLVCRREEEGDVVGFITGIVNPKGFYLKFLKERWGRIACAVVPKAVIMPSMLVKLGKGLLYPSKSPAGEENAVITSIAVLPEWQRGGLGSLLLERFQKEAAARGITHVITGAKRHETKVIAFYERDGFLIDRAEQNPGYGDSMLLTKTLSTRERASLG